MCSFAFVKKINTYIGGVRKRTGGWTVRRSDERTDGTEGALTMDERKDRQKDGPTERHIYRIDGRTDRDG